MSLNLPAEMDEPLVVRVDPDVVGDRRVVHDSSDGETPGCGTFHSEDPGGWRRVDGADLDADRWRICKMCNPDHKLQGTSPAKQLRAGNIDVDIDHDWPDDMEGGV